MFLAVAELHCTHGHPETDPDDGGTVGRGVISGDPPTQAEEDENVVDRHGADGTESLSWGR